MKEIFDRNRDRMTDTEDRRIWGALFDATRKPQPAWKRWRVAAPVLATVTAAVVVVALVNRGPGDLARERVMADRAEVTAPVDDNTAAQAQAGQEAAESAPNPVLADTPEGIMVAEEGGLDEASPKQKAHAADADAERPLKVAKENLGETLDITHGTEETEEAGALSNETRVGALAESRKPEPTQAEIARVDTGKLEAKPTESIPPPAPERRAQVEMEAGRGFISGQVTSASGDSLAFANIVLLGTRMGATTDEHGNFRIREVPPGMYTMKISYLGYVPIEREIEVIAGKELALNFDMQEAELAYLPEVLVEAKKEMIRRTESSAAHRLRQDESGTGADADALHFRGGRAGEAEYQVDRLPVNEQPVASADANDKGAARAKPLTRQLSTNEAKRGGSGPCLNAPPIRPQPGEKWPISVGGTDPVNGQAFDAMFFEHYGVNPFVDPQDDRFATFAMDVDNASFAMARSYLTRGELPPKEAIRVEEFINAFDHQYAPPRNLRVDRRPWYGESEHGTFAIHLDAAPSPFGDGLVLMRVGLKGREIDLRDRKPAVLTFVIDVSGSMAREDRLELVKRSLYLLLDQMNDEDEVGLVVYGSNARTILPHTSLRYRRDIERAIASLHPEGATNAEDGLRQGYALADRGFRRDHINRVILCSDGVANVGRTGADGILAEIKREASRGIEMTAVGFGMGNYNDVLMEKLADQGDGNYYYVDDIAEARRVFVENLTGTLQTIARQAKIQVEFDPETVRRYRLIGYENRDVADRDFRNDAVDAGEVGAGHEVTALFEVKLEKNPRTKDMATVRIRYEDPESGKVTEEARTLRRSDVARRLDDTDATFRMDAAVAEFAEILRHSYWAKGGDLAEVVGLAKNAARDLGPREDVEEILGMAETAWKLWPRDQVPDWRDDIRPSWEPDDDYPQLKQDD